VFTPRGGIPYALRSDDRGETFRATDGLPLLGEPRELRVAPSDPQRLYLAPENSLTQTSPALYTSTDGGSSWQRRPIPSPLPLDIVHRVTVDPRDADRVWVQVGGRFLRTEDGGATWSSALPTPESHLTAVSAQHGPSGEVACSASQADSPSPTRPTTSPSPTTPAPATVARPTR
jgi:hypothetical protein